MPMANATAIAVHVVCACAYGTSESWALCPSDTLRERARLEAVSASSSGGGTDTLSAKRAARHTRTTNAVACCGKPYQERCLTATLSHVFVKHVDEGKTALPASTIVTAVRHFPSFQAFGWALTAKPCRFYAVVGNAARSSQHNLISPVVRVGMASRFVFLEFFIRRIVP